MNCYITNQVNEYCNQEEAFCSECGGNMYEDEFDSSILECSECDNTCEKEEE